jgi:antitoxin (DNA-binding transcriptional repressor) of toxin-antitoxin stability system
LKQIDLDDLPPRVAQTLASLAEGEELVLAQGGAVVARLVVADPAPPPAPGELLADLTPEEQAKEVLEQFSAMINDEF